jgi:dTDP-D-glucose 4,6-dehydratase
MATKHSILLTGGAGFIGTHILSMFPDTQFVVADIQSSQQILPNTIYIKADVRNETDMRPIFEQHRFDCVLHLAAAHKDFGIEQEEYFEVNENGTALVSQLAGEYGIQKVHFLFFCSCLWR